jgi:hypothetical protein
MTGRAHSDETRKKFSDAKKGENHNNFGHNHNEEIRKKKNVGCSKGKTHSEESKQKKITFYA